MAVTTAIEMDTDALRAREAAVALESDEEIMDRMRDNFHILDDMTQAVKNGDVRSMIVSGPPGCGKSHSVEAVLRKDDLFDTLADRAPKYEIIKGSMSSIGLYCKLWEHRKENHVMVLDDADDLFNSEESLNLLKGALDSGEKRIIAWNKDSRVLRDEAIDNSFEFRGSVIFITNLNFNMVKNKKLRAHLNALESRSHMIELGMDTMREKFLLIHQKVGDGMLDKYSFGDDGNRQLVSFMQDNATKFREISLRMVTKVADLKRAFPQSWQRMTSTTCMIKA